MENIYSAPMAIVDFIPVVFFFSAAMVLCKDLRNKMGKGTFITFLIGSVMVLVSGFNKALWKILMAFEVADVVPLNKSFFLIQSIGYLLALIGIALLLVFRGKIKVQSGAKGVAIPVVGSFFHYSTVPFIALQCIGCAGLQFCLFRISRIMKKILPAILFVVSFVFMLGMGYLGAKFDDSSSMHWIAQLTNIVSQGSLFAGVLILHAAGLGKPDSLSK